ncbi:hypothetical protein [Celeribacter arenosi]|uniref:GNAT family N-acetyltransferase n=1 Tax=Celeribacter arenosi TaxID=792649 RepID=A0ABP7JVL5_9RHOB
MEITPIISRADWDALADMADAALPQRWIYGAAAQAVGRDVMRVAIGDPDRPAAIAQIITRRIAGMSVGLISRGPIFLRAGHARPVLRALRAATPALTLMTPENPIGAFSVVTGLESATLNLTPPLQDLRAGLHGKWRNALVQSERANLPVAQPDVTPEALMPLLAAEKARQATGKYRALPPEFSLALHAASARDLLLLTCLDAQMLFVLHGTSATYHMAHAGARARSANAHNLMLWRAIGVLKSRGVRHLDLGTIDKDRAPDLARFKMRTGAKIHRLGGTGPLIAPSGRAPVSPVMPEEVRRV